MVLYAAVDDREYAMTDDNDDDIVLDALDGRPPRHRQTASAPCFRQFRPANHPGTMAADLLTITNRLTVGRDHYGSCSQRVHDCQQQQSQQHQSQQQQAHQQQAQHAQQAQQQQMLPEQADSDLSTIVEFLFDAVTGYL